MLKLFRHVELAVVAIDYASEPSVRLGPPFALGKAESLKAERV